MLLIRDLPDLKKYLESRRDMAKGQNKSGRDIMSVGIVYGFEQAIEAVQALIDNDKVSVEITDDDVPTPSK